MPGASHSRTVGYFYSESKRRFLQTEDEFAYQFDKEFTIVPFRCTSEFDQWGVEVGSYMATPCPNGNDMYMRYCDVTGWNEDKSRNTCDQDDDVTAAPQVEQPAEADGMMMLIVLISCAIVL